MKILKTLARYARKTIRGIGLSIFYTGASLFVVTLSVVWTILLFVPVIVYDAVMEKTK